MAAAASMCAGAQLSFSGTDALQSTQNFPIPTAAVEIQLPLILPWKAAS